MSSARERRSATRIPHSVRMRAVRALHSVDLRSNEEAVPPLPRPPHSTPRWVGVRGSWSRVKGQGSRVKGQGSRVK
eukprot:620818-Rhodomonas_salina.1